MRGSVLIKICNFAYSYFLVIALFYFFFDKVCPDHFSEIRMIFCTSMSIDKIQVKIEFWMDQPIFLTIKGLKQLYILRQGCYSGGIRVLWTHFLVELLFIAEDSLYPSLL